MIFQVVAQFEVYVKAKLGVIPSGAVLQAEGGISRVPNPHFAARNIPRPLVKTRVFETLHQAIRKLKLSHYHIPVRLLNLLRYSRSGEIRRFRDARWFSDTRHHFSTMLKG
jgi:hypothetical protein